MSEIDVYDSSSTLKKKEPRTYYQSRRLQNVVNPVDSTYKQRFYDSRGVLNEVDDEISGGAPLGKTQYNVNPDRRLASETRYKTGTGSDSWSFSYGWLGDLAVNTDGDSKTVQTVRDDLGRNVKVISPDQTYPTFRIYDAAGRVVEIDEADNYPITSQNHTFTYDYLGRSLRDDYYGNCPTGTSQPEIQRAYDAMPSGITCPISGGCTNIAGRLAYVKTQLLCSSAYSATDGSLDQETFYAYDAAGRVTEEYVRDDSGRAADHKYSWTKNGALSQFITPSGATLSWTFGSSGNNSDADLVTSIAQSSTTIVSSIGWFPFGPLASYKQSSTKGGLPLQTVISRNLAYRITDTQMNNGSAEYEGVNIGEDSKGRVIKRDYYDNSSGVQDSYLIYDEEDRILCETTSLASTCPTPTGGLSTVKNDRITAPYFTNAGDWKDIARFDRGALNTDTFSLNSGTHQISQVAQGGTLGNVNYTYNVLGDRASDGGTGSDETHTGRTYTYDGRHNLVNVRMQFIYCRCGFRGMAVWHYFDLASAFDARGRRVSKSFYDETTGDMSTLFYYYDAADRLTEMVYTPHITSPSTYSVYQVAWLASRPIMHTQTDYPAASVSRRYTVLDESDRTISMWTWPTSGDSTRVWAINPSAWAYDVPPILGASILQPLVFAGQYLDWETYAVADTTVGTLYHEPALSLSELRTYDPFVGGFLQLDQEASNSRSAYVYASSNPVANRNVKIKAVTSSELPIIPPGGDCVATYYFAVRHPALGTAIEDVYGNPCPKATARLGAGNGRVSQSTILETLYQIPVGTPAPFSNPMGPSMVCQSRAATEEVECTQEIGTEQWDCCMLSGPFYGHGVQFHTPDGRPPCSVPLYPSGTLCGLKNTTCTTTSGYNNTCEPSEDQTDCINTDAGLELTLTPTILAYMCPHGPGL